MHNVILGGGIAGLTSAILLARKGVSDILLVEANQELGGLLRSFNYGSNGKFDYGTHCLSDAYGDEINDVFGHIVQSGDWKVHEGIRSELSGVYHHKQLNDKTVFVDMKVFPEQEYSRF